MRHGKGSRDGRAGQRLAPNDFRGDAETLPHNLWGPGWFPPFSSPEESESELEAVSMDADTARLDLVSVSFSPALKR